MSDDVDRLKDVIERHEEAARIDAAFKGWSPTAANVNALPEPLRGYIHQLDTVCDPAGDQQSIVILRDTVRSLQQLVVEQEDELKAAQALWALSDRELPDGTLCWCSNDGPPTEHSHRCGLARAVLGSSPALTSTDEVSALDPHGP